MGKRELKDFVADNDEENEQHSVQQSNACDVNALENVDLRIVENVANDPEHFVDHHVMEEIQSELEINNNVIVETVEQHNEDLEDEQDMNMVNNVLKKIPNEAPFKIPAEIKTLLETKVKNIKPEDWTLDTLKNSGYTLYRFLSELRTSSFTEEYLKTHKKSGKGGKTGTVEWEPMEPKIIEEIVGVYDYLGSALRPAEPFPTA
ncbi:hypothetical protein OUZ56_009659 [Daphnia magna]|uniref:Uncharacterized protein n=1 Tax=Daphnia magna TaxID=35525 RepID=A0ABR0AGL4_9CRUS|nr:hypothetical protein OUZ56_009659 [Daphnia magna]